jgi:hypothetical protein
MPAAGRLAALPALALALSACGDLGCSTLARSKGAGASLADTAGATGSALIDVQETSATGIATIGPRQLKWEIRAGPLTAAVTGVHLHEGAAGDTGRLIYDFPAGSPVGDVISRMPTWTEYAGLVPFNQFFALLGGQPAYIDVHTTAAPEGTLRGQVTLLSENDWGPHLCN